ncbi:extracellular catalytic domain type 1 short-chain-length polyhydroxyalkanoate depolymerase [Pseudomonas corrugata]|uniref:extracellular catalytic domain type 1 short-chain-length polyhydroxyalkanoate depolymerase n=1 Tax=Pseudomonas corrugata TaxID=47879 RepID=UPI0015867AA1|nr:PHB depolymerase family esterase [Pseudomonas corrugata]MCI0997831.1 dienelactone hydrolase family protein [Pseudomonas corrugata]NUT69149.1 alpha/beta hydrolase fold domain-containing protein [Pseudomonas corrugata]
MNRARLFLTYGLIAASLVGTVEAQPRLLERLREAREARAERAEQADNSRAVSKTLRVGGLDRSYLLLDEHRGNGPAPLVIVLHGGGGSPETMIPRWEQQAQTAGLVVAAPKGIGRNDRMGTWNASGCCGEAVSKGVDDVGFVAAVIDDVSKQMQIDRRRIYVAGFSNGGMLTHRVAIALGDRIAAAAVVSGALFGNESTARTPVPMLVIHGEQDPVVGFNGGMSQTGFVAKGQTIPFEPVRYAVNFWRRANGCKDNPSVTQRPGVKMESSVSCHGNADIVFYDLPNGGHSWPGSSSGKGLGRSGSDSGASAAPIDATSTIWEFFEAHTR